MSRYSSEIDGPVGPFDVDRMQVVAQEGDPLSLLHVTRPGLPGTILCVPLEEAVLLQPLDPDAHRPSGVVVDGRFRARLGRV